MQPFLFYNNMETQKKEKLQMPPKTLLLKIGTNDYDIKFPTNGQRIDIEVKKISATNGTHRDLLQGGPSAVEAYMIVDALATFSVLIPKLSTDLTANLLELDPLQSKSILKAYEKYYDWDQKWREFLNQDVEEDEK